MQNYTIKARVIYETKADTINQAVFSLYKLILPSDAATYNESNDSIMVNFKYVNAIDIEEISQ